MLGPVNCLALLNRLLGHGRWCRESSRSSRHVVVCVLVPSPPVVVVNVRVAVKPSSLMDVVTVVVSVASVDVVVVVVVMVESDGLANGLAGGERDLGGLAEALRLRSMALRLGPARTCPWTRTCFGAIGRGRALPGRFPLLLTWMRLLPCLLLI